MLYSLRTTDDESTIEALHDDSPEVVLIVSGPEPKDNLQNHNYSGVIQFQECVPDCQEGNWVGMTKLAADLVCHVVVVEYFLKNAEGQFLCGCGLYQRKYCALQSALLFRICRCHSIFTRLYNGISLI